MAEVEIVNIAGKKSDYDGTEHFAGQNHGGGVDSSFDGQLQDIASFVTKVKSGWWNIHPSDFAGPVRQYLSTTGWDLLTNDNAGIASSNDDYSPTGVPNPWNPTTHQFGFSSLAIGDTFGLRVDMDITTTANNQEVLLRGRWGIGGTVETIMLSSFNRKSIGGTQFSEFVRGPIASGNIRDNFGDIQIWSDSDFTYSLRMIYLEVSRR